MKIWGENDTKETDGGSKGIVPLLGLKHMRLLIFDQFFT